MSAQCNYYQGAINGKSGDVKVNYQWVMPLLFWLSLVLKIQLNLFKKELFMSFYISVFLLLSLSFNAFASKNSFSAANKEWKKQLKNSERIEYLKTIL